MDDFAELLQIIIDENSPVKAGIIIAGISGIQEYLRHRYPHPKMCQSDRVILFRKGEHAPRCANCNNVVATIRNVHCSLKCVHEAVFARYDAIADKKTPGSKAPRDPWAVRVGY